MDCYRISCLGAFMEKGVKGDEEGVGDAVGDDVQWVFSGKKGYCEGVLIA